MQLRLKYAPLPENAPKFAADIVQSAAEVSGAELDYSVASLETVDAILEGLRQDGCTSQQLAETLFSFGCYVGEVFVRHAGGQWRRGAETPLAELGSFPLLIALGNDSALGPDKVCNPIGKVFKRLDNGEQDSLAYFYQVFTT